MNKCEGFGETQDPNNQIINNHEGYGEPQDRQSLTWMVKINVKGFGESRDPNNHNLLASAPMSGKALGDEKYMI